MTAGGHSFAHEGARTASTCASRIASMERRLSKLPGGQRSLCPGRGAATPIGELVTRTGLSRGSPERLALVDGLHALIGAILRNFPETIFWDLDRLVADVAACSASVEIEARFARMCALQDLYGRDGPIRFRYAHDFTYGWDWCRWVARAPHERAIHGPHSEAFLGYLATRGAALVEQIANDDENYPRLPDGTPRNPFRFSRDPVDESRLLRTLAEAGHVPVPAWSPTAPARWELPFARLREVAAARLGLTRSPERS